MFVLEQAIYRVSQKPRLSSQFKTNNIDSSPELPVMIISLIPVVNTQLEFWWCTQYVGIFTKCMIRSRFEISHCIQQKYTNNHDFQPT